ncbi:unnamed protein product, partial [Tetraodon nigroviridis]
PWKVTHPHGKSETCLSGIIGGGRRRSAPLRHLRHGVGFCAQLRSLPLDPARLRTSGDCSFLPFQKPS